MAKGERRVKTPKTVITFASTADAMAMDAAAGDNALPGRLVPVPSEIDAGCGFAWAAEAACRARLLARMDELGLAREGVHEVLMY